MKAMKRTYSRLPSFSSPEPEAAPQLWSKLQRLQGCPISGERLAKTLDFFISTQRSGIEMAKDAFTPNPTFTKTEWKLIDCYLDSNLLLLDACDTIQHKLQSIRRHLCSFNIALHYLEGEHEPSTTVLNRVLALLDSSDFKDKQHCFKLEKCFSKLRTLGKKLDDNFVGGGISSELYKALSGSWAMSVLATGVLGSATCSPCIQFSKADDSWAMLLNEVSNRMKKFPMRRGDESFATLEELTGMALAGETLLKLVSALQKGGKSGVMRRMAVKAVAGELRMRKQEFEKVLKPIEEKIGELYRLLVDLRMRLLGLISTAENEEAVMELVLKPDARWEDGKWAVILLISTRQLSLGLDAKPKRRIGCYCFGSTRVKSSSLIM